MQKEEVCLGYSKAGVARFVLSCGSKEKVDRTLNCVLISFSKA